MNEMSLVKIGKVKKDVTGSMIQIEEEFRDALLWIDGYSHIHVFWWANELDGEDHRQVLVCDIPYSAEKVEAGVFACRSPERPNPLMTTVCEVKGINKKKGRIFIENIDAFGDTPVIDIKPYIPCVDRVKKAKVPGWIPEEWGDWVPKGGIY